MGPGRVGSETWFAYSLATSPEKPDPGQTEVLPENHVEKVGNGFNWAWDGFRAN